MPDKYADLFSLANIERFSHYAHRDTPGGIKKFGISVFNA
jgi:hypothetical protein